MKIVTYNVNGIRASGKLGLVEWLQDFDADIYCIQEVRSDEGAAREVLFAKQEQISFFDQTSAAGLLGYNAIYNCGERAGYAGSLVLTKKSPDKIIIGMEEFWQDNEGRTMTLIFGDFAVVNSYVPNGNSRLDFKMEYLAALTKFLEKLKKDYKVVCVGDFNIAHNEIDLTHPKQCKNKSVFLPEERAALNDILGLGFVDSFRICNPEKVEYSWRSYRSRKDLSYNSWKYRIDYILVDKALENGIRKCQILDLLYSDHYPVAMEFNLGAADENNQ